MNKKEIIAHLTDALEKAQQNLTPFLNHTEALIQYFEEWKKETQNRKKAPNLKMTCTNSHFIILYLVLKDDTYSENTFLSQTFDKIAPYIDNNSLDKIQTSLVNSKTEEEIEGIEEMKQFFKTINNSYLLFEEVKAMELLFENPSLPDWDKKMTKLITVLSEKVLYYKRKKKNLEEKKRQTEKYIQNLIATILKDEVFLNYQLINEQYLSKKTSSLLYRFIYKNYEEQIKKLTEENKKLSTKMEEKQLEKILFTYFPNTHFTKEEKQILKEYGNLEQIKENISILKKTKIAFQEYSTNDICLMLLTTTKEEIETILRLTATGQLNYQILSKNPSIFLNEEKEEYQKWKSLSIKRPLYQTVLKNAEIMKNAGVDFTKKTYKPDMLLQDRGSMQNNFYLFQIYQNYIDTQQNNPCLFLSNPDLFFLIDTLLENDLDPSEIDFTNIVSNVEDIQKRILLSKEVGIEVISSQNQILPIIESGNNFYLSKQEVDSLVPARQKRETRLITDKISEEHPILAYLDASFLENESVYQIAGSKISRAKVLANLYRLKTEDKTEEEILHMILFTFSFITEEESKRLIKEIKGFSKTL